MRLLTCSQYRSSALAPCVRSSRLLLVSASSFLGSFSLLPSRMCPFASLYLSLSLLTCLVQYILGYSTPRPSLFTRACSCPSRVLLLLSPLLDAFSPPYARMLIALPRPSTCVPTFASISPLVTLVLLASCYLFSSLSPVPCRSLLRRPPPRASPFVSLLLRRSPLLPLKHRSRGGEQNDLFSYPPFFPPLVLHLVHLPPLLSPKPIAAFVPVSRSPIPPVLCLAVP